MPDHAHLLVEALNPTADLRQLVKRWKQSTGISYARARGRRLWQPGYFERVLRIEEGTEQVARYIVMNPLRAGLSQKVGEYPYAWAVGLACDGAQD